MASPAPSIIGPHHTALNYPPSATAPAALTALSGSPTQPRCTLAPLPTARVP